LWGNSGFSAIKKSLIDFPVYEQNIETVVENDKKIHEEVVKNNAAYDLTNYGFPAVQFTKEDWVMDKWKVILASSANTLKNNFYSYCKKVPSKRFNDVLGVRIHFIEGRFLSWALIKPPYGFFAYYDDGTYVNQGKDGEENALVMGILVNVGQIKSISSWVYGLNYQHQVGVRIKDRVDNISDYFLGSVYYDGWRKLVWVNPEYAENIQDRILQRIPLYPRSYPYIVFDSFVVYKPETELGGDFVIYFKDVEVEFDRAIVREELDIDDEAQWGILATERLQKKLRDLIKTGEQLYLQKQEEARQSASEVKTSK